ncbi:SAM-dependent methyltransferase [Amycolatopsis lexingtonensis]|uniref:SAM-dependent methyltransferase n=1 Tax=Amycolatopsis lexingtonensis TaxID=218822 RepID=A0ABR9IG41_9PSEU|nr:class I SAM-dependent methyltransferase [Amycolatopsis lexingtonensis]MBE1502135.1 SAM-dependent methyltransferase [Amycolatopsis lexingtonensis]
MSKTLCQTCGDVEVRKFLSLGQQPSFHFPANREEAENERLWPLELGFCEQCSLVQVLESVSERILFSGDYHHLAGLTAGYHEHLQGLADTLAGLFDSTDGRSVVEFGSNDGSLLDKLAARSFDVLGVDPVGQVTAAGSQVVKDYFSSTVGADLAATRGKTDLVVALNVFAHVTNLHDVLDGVTALLKDDGLFVTESHYLVDLLETLQYDFAYHEHSRYYSVTALDEAFRRHGLETVKIERIPTHGGSIRVYAGFVGEHEVDQSVIELRELEDSLKLRDSMIYTQFAERVEQHREKLNELVRFLKNTGARVAAASAPGRAVTMLNYCGLGPDDIDVVSEISPRKIGKLFPGTHIPIISQQELAGDNQPEYALLMSWHIADEVITNLRNEGFRGTLIEPLPEPRILER